MSSKSLRKPIIEIKQKTLPPNTSFMNLEWVPATSCIAERAISQSGLIYSELRQSLSPYHLECAMFLKYNMHLWDMFTVTTILNNHPDDK